MVNCYSAILIMHEQSLPERLFRPETLLPASCLSEFFTALISARLDLKRLGASRRSQLGYLAVSLTADLTRSARLLPQVQASIGRQPRLNWKSRATFLRK